MTNIYILHTFYITRNSRARNPWTVVHMQVTLQSF